MGAFYCSICRKTDFSGKGHIYGKSHQSKLKVILVKFMEKVKEAKRTIKNPQVEKYSPDHDEKFWCYCCALEVQKHVTDSNISVLYGGLLEHMSTPEHRTNTHKFWWDNKADPKLRDKFIITEEETERFKSEVSKSLEQFEEKEDVFIKQQAAVIRSQEQLRLEVLQSLSEVCFPGNRQALIQTWCILLKWTNTAVNIQPVPTVTLMKWSHNQGRATRISPHTVSGMNQDST